MTEDFERWIWYGNYENEDVVIVCRNGQGISGKLSLKPNEFIGIETEKRRFVIHVKDIKTLTIDIYKTKLFTIAFGE